jgi:hypothetical protein
MDKKLEDFLELEIILEKILLIKIRNKKLKIFELNFIKKKTDFLWIFFIIFFIFYYILLYYIL